MSGRLPSDRKPLIRRTPVVRSLYFLGDLDDAGRHVDDKPAFATRGTRNAVLEAF